MENLIWGLDLGGTKIEGVVLNKPNSTETLCRLRIPTEASQGYEHIIQQIKKLIDMMANEVGQNPKKIGICTPGALDPKQNTMKNSNTTSLNGKPFKDDLEKALGVPVVLANDANCFALAEAKLGAAAELVPNAESVFGVIMGTGVGGGVVVNGKLLTGRHGIGGEWGHNFLHKSGGPCYCGLVGCVETVISGTGLQKYYYEQTGKSITLKEIYQAYKADTDSVATDTINRLMSFFGKGLSSIVNVLDPDAIVLGGGVGNIPELYTLGVAELEKNIFNHKLETLILKPKLGDSAGVFGAAMLVA